MLAYLLSRVMRSIDEIEYPVAVSCTNDTELKPFTPDVHIWHLMINPTRA